MTPQQKAQAEALIGTQVIPDQYRLWRMFAAEAMAYHAGTPYPAFAFRGWRNEERGALPLVLPFVQGVARKSAKWLYGKPLQFESENEEYEALIEDAWADSNMPVRLVAAAEIGAVAGQFGIKFSYAEDGECPVRFHIVQPWMMRVFRDPHDAETVLMVRIQYPYRDYASGNLMLYREDWTERTHAVYEPREITGFYDWDRPEKAPGVATSGQDIEEQYRGQDALSYTAKPNPFGVIPIVQVNNIDTGKGYGAGDLWGQFRIVDRINLAFALSDRHNQKNVDPRTLFLDLDADADDPPQVNAPGEPVVMDSSSEKHAGRVQQIIADVGVRPHIREYAEDLKRMLFDAVGTVSLNEADVTNKGNLTQAVLTQMYAPLVLATEEKRKTHGSALTLLFDTLAHALANLRVRDARIARLASGFDPTDPASYRVSMVWPDHFEATDEDKAARLARYTAEIEARLMPREVALQRVAMMEGVTDFDTYASLIEAQPDTGPGPEPGGDDNERRDDNDDDGRGGRDAA